MVKIICFLIIIPIIILAQTEIALIVDKDGYANIRSGPGMSYVIIDTIRSNEHILFYNDDNNHWIKVKKKSGPEGYIHRSRIKPLNQTGFLIDGTIFSNYVYDIKLNKYYFDDLTIEHIRIRSKKEAQKNEIYIDCRCWLNVKKSDSLISKVFYKNILAYGSCAGIYLPAKQPKKKYFIASKFGDYEGEILIINNKGQLFKEAGGTFFITNDGKYLVSNWDSDLSGISIFSFDESTFIFSEDLNFFIADWYEINGIYYALPDNRIKKNDIVYLLNFEKTKLEPISKNNINISTMKKINLWNNVYNLKDCVCK